MDIPIWVWLVGGFLLLGGMKIVKRLTRKSGLVTIGALVLGYFLLTGGINLGSIGATTTAGMADITKVEFTSGLVNVTTDADFLNDGKDVITLYIDDADQSDAEYLNISYKVYRSSTDADTAAYDVVCTGVDTTFTSGATNYDLVQLDANNFHTAYISGDSNWGGTANENGVSSTEAFSSTAVTDTGIVSIAIDETAEDAASSKDQFSYVCSFGDQSAEIVMVVND